MHVVLRIPPASFKLFRFDITLFWVPPLHPISLAPSASTLDIARENPVPTPQGDTRDRKRL